MAPFIVWTSPMIPKMIASSTNGNDSRFSSGTNALNTAMIPSTNPVTARPDVGFFSIMIPFFSWIFHLVGLKKGIGSRRQFH